MPSDLQVDNIKDGSATKTLATLSSSAVTLHSDVVFPGPPSSGTFNAGHIIQMTTNTSTTGASGVGTILAVSHSITMSDSSNKLLVFATMQWQLSGGSGDARYGGTQLVTSGSGVTAQTYTQTTQDSSGSYGIRFNHTGFSDASFANVVPINYLFSPAYQGAVTVTANMLGYSSIHGTVNTNVQDGTDGSSTIMLMEVVAYETNVCRSHYRIKPKCKISSIIK